MLFQGKRSPNSPLQSRLQFGAKETQITLSNLRMPEWNKTPENLSNLIEAKWKEEIVSEKTVKNFWNFQFH